MKAAFLDRDGTIVREYPDEQWANITEPEFMDGAIEGLRIIQNKGFKLIIITNQPLINEEIITQAQYEIFTTKMLSVLKSNGISIFNIKYCPHARWEGCPCRKPRTGMIDAIRSERPDLILEESFLAGDRESDMKLAKSLGIRFFKVMPTAVEHNSSTVYSLASIPNYL